MHLVDDRWIFSATDLSTFVRCEHAIELRRQNKLGILKPLAAPERSIRVEMLSRRGSEHESAYIDKLRQNGFNVVEIDSNDVVTGRERTLDAMHSAADVIVQAVLTDDKWLGYADLLERIGYPSNLGPWSYEAVDTKLAQSVQPHFILQIGVYSRLLAAIQGALPHAMHIVLGDESRESFAVRDFSAYLDRISRRFERHFLETPPTAPYPVEFCGLCEWNRHCWKHLLQLDHLSLVANIRRDQVKRLEQNGVPTLTALGEAPLETRVRRIPPPTFERLHHQARLQLAHKRTKRHRYEFLEPEEGRGFQLLPEPATGDLFFDIEADPFEDLVYLFGIGCVENGDKRYRAWWAHDSAEERRAFEEVIDFMVQARRENPGAHVYHYGPMDVAALKKLMGTYGTREDELDDLLRQQAFGDLLNVVRQSIRISQPSYSLKKVEVFYYDRESPGVIDAGGAIVAYEDWLQTRDQETLGEIEAYNKDDCYSTIELRSWLLRLRDELQSSRGIELAWRTPRPAEPTREERERTRLETDRLSGALVEGLAKDHQQWNDEDRARNLLANLLHYHRREDKPEWWLYFERLGMSPEELVEDGESIGNLRPTGKTRQIDKSAGVEFEFEPQEHKLELGHAVHDPHNVDGNGFALSAGTIVSLDSERGLVELKRGDSMANHPLPKSIIHVNHVGTKPIEAALQRIASTVSEQGFEGGPYRAASDILLRHFPRIRGIEPGTPLQDRHADHESVKRLSRDLDESYLFIQGPPGSGKTWTGGRIIVDLIRNGLRIGVTASTHKAINNLLTEVERVAEENGVSFSGLKISNDDSQRYESKHPLKLIRDSSEKFPRGKKPEPTDARIRLVAGTPWVFSKPEYDRTFDALVIDEAGQMSLANALASSTAARNVVLLGDPLQLAQVSQASHPVGSGASVLEHLLGSDPTVPPERGIFLEQTWRMHPDVCRFISDVVYDARLESEPECARQRIDAPFLTDTGLRFAPIEHDGNTRSSDEEAEWIAGAIMAMLDGATLTSRKGISRALSPADIMVVAPYNAQVRTIRNALESRGLRSVPVGTVDKFQGQEAEVVFFSMATSSGEDVPRTLDFLFSRNRLNVAISRARCLAVLVASPRLLDVECRTVEQMKLVNALCRFVEMAKTSQ